MKRRMFLSSASTVGVIGVASGGTTIVSSAYSSISESVSLAEFSPIAKNVLDKFITELSTSVQEGDFKKELINQVAMPVRIISTDFKNNNHKVVYKNKVGDYVSLSMKNGKEIIHLSKTLN